MSEAALFLVRGDDKSLITRAVQKLVDALVGDAERSLVVEELLEADYRDEDGSYSIAPVIDAAQTPPFLTEFRVVIGRELGRFNKADHIKALVRYLEDPLETSRLILTWEKGPELQRLNAIPKALLAAVEAAAGEVIDARAPRGKGAVAWIEEQVAGSDIRLSQDATRLLSDHLGEDQSRLPGLLETLRAVFGAGTSLDREDVLPYLGQAGDVAPWELSDSIAVGDVPASLDKLHRMQRSGERHALQILASLHGHYARLLRLDGTGIRDENAAATVLGMKGSTFPAKKALQQARKLGYDRVSRAIELLAQADLDIRGATSVPDTTTMEVLVARLATLHR